MKHVAVALLLAAVATLARGQSGASVPAPTIAGRVVAADTGDPVRNARVIVGQGPLGNTVVLSDGDGRFSVAVPTRSTMTISKTGFAARTVEVPHEDLAIRLDRAAALGGRVVDQFGEPIVDAFVLIERRNDAQSDFRPAGRTATDDRGEYRIGGLAAGTFVVQVIVVADAVARPVNGGVSLEPLERRFYYPGTSSRERAEGLDVAVGEERTAIDFVLPGNVSGERFGMIAASGLGRNAVEKSPNATGIIRGRVVGIDGRPLTQAIVRLFVQPPFPLQSVRSDAAGRFEFTQLRAGKYRVTAAKPGFTARTPAEADTVMASFGAGPWVDIGDGETRERVDIALARLGTLTGQVLDEFGDPIDGVNVQLLRIEYDRGQKRLVAASTSARQTDDHGRYRLFNIQPGRYIVSATVGGVSSADVPGYARSYFPGTPNPGEAQFISIGAAQDTSGVDVQLVRTRTSRIAGRILDASGQPTTGGSLLLRPVAPSMLGVSTGARSLPDGRFEFPNVPPGAYVIVADRGRRNGNTEGEFAAVPVAVNGADVDDLIVQTSTGSSVTGRITFDAATGAHAPSPQSIEIQPVPVDADRAPANVATAAIRSDWTFEMRGINGPRRLQLQRAPDGWALDQVRVDGIDVTDRPLLFGRPNQSLSDVEIVLTDRVNTVTGTVTDDRGEPVPAVTVVCFSVDRDRWYPLSRFLRSRASTADGSFTIAGLAGGTYYIAAANVPDEGPDAWQDSAFLESQMPRATTVNVTGGQTQRVTIRRR